MATLPKYIINLSGDDIKLTRSDGQPCTPQDVTWFKAVVRNALAGEANSHPQQQVMEYIDQFGEVIGTRHTIDPIVILFAGLRLWLRVPQSHIGMAMGVNKTTVPAYARGKARVEIGMLRAWGAVLQHEIVAVPFALRSTVKKMVADFYRERRFNPFTSESYVEYLRSIAPESKADLEPKPKAELKLDANELPEFDLTTEVE